MKKLLCTAVLILMLTVIPALVLAETAITLYTSDYTTTIHTIGMYAYITRSEPELRSGPDTYYSGFGFTDWNNMRVRCLSLACDESRSPWVLIDVDTGNIRARGYVPLDWFDPATSYELTGYLPFEEEYDELTPLMIAQLYESTLGYWGPGYEYEEDDPLDVLCTEGTIILADGGWALLELPEFNFPDVPFRFRKRVWVEMSNLMY